MYIDFSIIEISDKVETKDFKSLEPVYLVYSKDDFYIFNGFDKLVCLTGDWDIETSKFTLLKACGNSGTHIMAESQTMDAALEAFNNWKPFPEHFYNWSVKQLPKK